MTQDCAILNVAVRNINNDTKLNEEKMMKDITYRKKI
jgi:hypothetical protein